MPHFLSLGWFDCYDLACSVKARMSQMKQWDDTEFISLDIRAPRKGTSEEDEDFAYLGSVVGKGRWPELTAMIKRIERGGAILGGIEFGRIYLDMLRPGAVTPWGEAQGEYFTRYTRLHMALRTNPGAIMYAGGEQMQMQPGWLNSVNVRVKHCAANFGQSPRVHLVLDTRKAEPEMAVTEEKDQA